MEIKGFKDLEKQLKKIEKEINKEAGGEVAFNDLFNESFMTENTSFQTIEEFFDKCPLDTSTQEAFENVDEDQLDEYVSKHTKFDKWEDMKQTAGSTYMAKKLKKLF